MPEQKWYCSLTVWLAIGGQIMSLLVLLGAINVTMHEAINGVLIAIGELLVLVGILNNPTRNHVAEIKIARETRRMAAR